MRIRAVAAIVLLLVPAVASAQRTPLPRAGRGPARPAPLPPQAPTIARELAYKRLPLSVESYPLISFVESSGFAEGALTRWTSAGMGTRLDYRVTRLVSATLDMTSSLFGGPARTQTVEFGTRLRPERSERRVYPFIDVRAGYAHAYDTYLRPMDYVDPYSTATPIGVGARYSQGVGAVGGGGIEVALTRMISLTTAASVMRTQMTTYGFRGARPATNSYRMTSYRYTLGIRFNPVRVIRPPGTALPASADPR